MVRRLLKSWASPPASWPSASSLLRLPQRLLGELPLARFLRETTPRLDLAASAQKRQPGRHDEREGDGQQDRREPEHVPPPVGEDAVGAFDSRDEEGVIAHLPERGEVPIARGEDVVRQRAARLARGNPLHEAAFVPQRKPAKRARGPLANDMPVGIQEEER